VNRFGQLESLRRAAARSLAGRGGALGGSLRGVRRPGVAEVSDAADADSPGAGGGGAGGVGRADGGAELREKWDASHFGGNNSLRVNTGNRSAKPLFAGSIPARASKVLVMTQALPSVEVPDFLTTSPHVPASFEGLAKIPYQPGQYPQNRPQKATFSPASHRKMGRVPRVLRLRIDRFSLEIRAGGRVPTRRPPVFLPPVAFVGFFFRSIAWVRRQSRGRLTAVPARAMAGRLRSSLLHQPRSGPPG
jgi:hypothetical protein